MQKPVFVALATYMRRNKLLANTWSSKGRTSVEQQLAIFLYIVSKAASNRNTGDRFNKGAETVHSHYHNVLNDMVALALEFIV